MTHSSQPSSIFAQAPNQLDGVETYTNTLSIKHSNHQKAEDKDVSVTFTVTVVDPSKYINYGFAD